MIHVFDVECAPNWFLLLAKCRKTKRIWRWERFDDEEVGLPRHELKAFMRQGIKVSFNGLRYDQHIVAAYHAGFDNEQMFKVSQFLIHGDNLAPWRVGDEFGIEPLSCSHIDLMPVAPHIASLKIYGGRIDAPKLQDLPFDPESSVSKQVADDSYSYCVNDLDTTLLLFEKLKPQLQLRKAMSRDYGVNLLSKSDPQIAEIVIKHGLNKLGVYPEKDKVKPREGYFYEAPTMFNAHTDLAEEVIRESFLGFTEYKKDKPSEDHHVHKLIHSTNPDGQAFKSKEMNVALANALVSRFRLSTKGALMVPPAFRKRIAYGNMKYQMGSGGLHSCEKSRSVDKRHSDIIAYITDLDVASFYPYIMINNRFAPEPLKQTFTDVYSAVVKERVEAKHSGDKVKADSLKIVANSTYGKAGSRFSYLYDPQLIIQTTVTGQLSLLMLIEMVHTNTNGKCKVISANTDGITVTSPDDSYREFLTEICSWWEEATGYELEANEYEAVFSQDVNNYMALTTEGYWKGKGVFADDGLQKNPKFRICTKALKDYLGDGVPIEDTIRQETNPAQFMALQKITGGGMWQGKEIGKTARWYIGIGGSDITRAKNGYRIGLSEGAILANEMPRQLPKNIDYDFYIQRAHSLLEGVGL